MHRDDEKVLIRRPRCSIKAVYQRGRAVDRGKPPGWNLLLVQDVRDAQHDDLEQNSTHKLTTRKYIHKKLDDYVVNLRKNEFPVEVYEDNLILLAQQEADMVKQLAERAAESGSVTQQRLEELQEIYK